MDVEASAKAILEDIKKGVGSGWDSLLDDAKEELTETATFMAELLARQAAGEDVTQDAKHIEAQVANWTFVGAAAAERSIWEFVLRIAEVAGTGLAALAKKGIGL